MTVLDDIIRDFPDLSLIEQIDMAYPTGPMSTAAPAPKEWAPKQQYQPRLSSDDTPTQLSPQAREAFAQLGDAQRNRPELQMLQVQDALGGGVVSSASEHTGDLSHRMSHMLGPNWGDPSDGREYVVNKTNSMLNSLNSGYGFEKEHQENLRSGARYRRETALQQLVDEGVQPGPNFDAQYSDEAHAAKANQELTSYAAEHRELPAHNRPQFLARESAVAIGEQDWPRARKMLTSLQKLAADPEAYGRAARMMRKAGPLGIMLGAGLSAMAPEQR